jgi:hypothetical protein
MHSGGFGAPAPPSALDLASSKDGEEAFTGAQSAANEWTRITTTPESPLLSDRTYSVFVVIRNSLGVYGTVAVATGKTQQAQKGIAGGGVALDWYPEWQYPLVHEVSVSKGVTVQAQANALASYHFGWLLSSPGSSIADAPSPTTLTEFQLIFSTNTAVRPAIAAGQLVTLTSSALVAGATYDLSLLAVSADGAAGGGSVLPWTRRVTLLSGNEIATGGPYDVGQSDKYQRITVCPQSDKMFKTGVTYEIRALDDQNWMGAGFQLYRLATPWVVTEPDVADNVQDGKTYQIRMGVHGITGADNRIVTTLPLKDPGYIPDNEKHPAAKRTFRFDSLSCPAGFYCPAVSAGQTPKIKYCGEGRTMNAASSLYCPPGSIAPLTMNRGQCGLTSTEVLGWPNWNVQVEPYPSTNFGEPTGGSPQFVAQLVQAMQASARACANLTLSATPRVVKMEQTDGQAFVGKRWFKSREEFVLRRLCGVMCGRHMWAACVVATNDPTRTRTLNLAVLGSVAVSVSLCLCLCLCLCFCLCLFLCLCLCLCLKLTPTTPFTTPTYTRSESCEHREYDGILASERWACLEG